MTLEVVPLGGLGEFGMHMMAFRCNGTIIVVDAGIMFPDEELLGVDIIVPDITYLLEKKSEVKAIPGFERYLQRRPRQAP